MLSTDFFCRDVCAVGGDGSSRTTGENGVLANLGVLSAVGLVACTESLWPDVAIGLLIVCVFLQSAWGIFQEAVGQPTTGVEAV